VSDASWDHSVMWGELAFGSARGFSDMTSIGRGTTRTTEQQVRTTRTKDPSRTGTPGDSDDAGDLRHSADGGWRQAQAAMAMPISMPQRQVSGPGRPARPRTGRWTLIRCEPTGQAIGGGVAPVTRVEAATTAAPTGSPTSALPTWEPTGGPEWTTGPVSVTRDNPIPPVPLLVGIRAAAHPQQGYDRIVFDFSGPLPGYRIRYVDEVREDPSDRLVVMPGRRYLLIVFDLAQAHTEAGESTIATRSATFDFLMLRAYVLTGDFEGYVSVALGLDDVVGFRVGDLARPNRIYVDVAA
jgi:hypothetical protein